MKDISSFSKPVSLTEIVSSFIPGPANGLEGDYTTSLVGRIVDQFHGHETEARDEYFIINWQNEKTLQVVCDGQAFSFEVVLVPGEFEESISDKSFILVSVVAA